MSQAKNKKYFIDLFAGCGGLSLGLENAGFFPIFVNELNEDALETYLLNREDLNPKLRSKFSVNDVKDLVLNNSLRIEIINEIKNEYGIDINKGELDLLAGGPPCQGFSGLGHRRSYSVEKIQLPSNQLYQDMAFLINEFKPKIFLFENVRGLLSSKWTKDGKKGEIWEDVLKTFKNIPNYSIKWKLVQAKDYGVPQNRPRVLLVGVRKDILFPNSSVEDALEGGYLPEPTFDYPSIEDLLSDLVDEDYLENLHTASYKNDPLTSIQEKLRTNIKTNRISKIGDEITDQVYSKHSKKIVEKFSYMINNNSEIPDEMKTKKFSQKVLPRVWGKNGPSITATSMPDDYVHYLQPRVLTVREWARLQTFPDWYKFSGKRTTGGIRRAGNPREGDFSREVPKYTQIGNAVPVELAYKLGLHFIKILEIEDDKNI